MTLRQILIFFLYFCIFVLPIYEETLDIYPISNSSSVVILQFNFQQKYEPSNISNIHVTDVFPIPFLHLQQTHDFDFYDLNFQQGKWDQNVLHKIKTNIDISSSYRFNFQIYENGASFYGRI